MPFPVFTSVVTIGDATTTSGEIFFSTYPEEDLIDNRDLGAVVKYDITTTSGVIQPKVNLDSNLRRTDVSISGSRKVGIK